jgi:hypothetical protein
MSLGYLDSNSYTFAGGFPVPSGKDLIIPDSLQLSQTMLVKWQIRQLAKGGSIDQIPPATLSAVLEIPGLGELDSDEHQIKASIQGHDRVQIISLDPTLPYKLTFSQTSELVTNSVLEFYTSTIAMGEFNNPANFNSDFSPVIAAIGAGSAAEVAAIAAQTAATTRKVVSETESTYAPTIWSNTPSNHVAVSPDPTRFGGSFYNNGAKPVAIDKFVDITTKTPAMQADGLLQPGGTYTFKQDEAALGYLIYTLTGVGGAASVLINLQK